MPSNDQTKTTYSSLLSRISQEIHTVEGNAVKFADQGRIMGNWKIGRMIAEFMLGGNKLAPRGEGLFERLARDTRINTRTLHQTVKFYRLYPSVNLKKGLTWTHYSLLITIADDQERKQWEHRIIKEEITSLQLRLMLRQTKASPEDSPTPQMAVERGRLYTYRISKVNYIHDSPSQLMLDCGFSIHIEQPMDIQLNISRQAFVRVEKSADGYVIKEDKSLTKDCLFTYKALVERVVDGDTVWVNIDCGFGIWCRQKLRLRGIDAPELPTDQGIRAKQFVQDQLADCGFIIVKTYGSDKYDRYLADIFYQAGINLPEDVAADGRLLNRQIVEQGLAKVWEG